jgi:hypothetical protein
MGRAGAPADVAIRSLRTAVTSPRPPTKTKTKTRGTPSAITSTALSTGLFPSAARPNRFLTRKITYSRNTVSKCKIVRDERCVVGGEGRTRPPFVALRPSRAPRLPAYLGDIILSCNIRVQCFTQIYGEGTIRRYTTSTKWGWSFVCAQRTAPIVRKHSHIFFVSFYAHHNLFRHIMGQSFSFFSPLPLSHHFARPSIFDTL